MTELDTQNAKKLSSSKFLKDIQNKDGIMMAVVHAKRKSDKNYIEVMVDSSHDKYLNMNCSEFEYH